METVNKIITWLNNSIGVKLVVIAILTLLLLIPGAMIMDLIREREQRRDDTIQEVTEIWGREQVLCGPVLTIPYATAGQAARMTSDAFIRTAHFLPTSLVIEGGIEPEIRYRGIFKVVVYHTKLHFSGDFSGLDLSELQIQSENIAGESIWLEIGIPDMRGINQEVLVTWNDREYTGIPGLASDAITGAGIRIELPADIAGSNHFSFDLDINGSNSLSFIPLGKNSKVSLSSGWTSPSFTGAFLPDDREVKDSGFRAEWNVLYLNRNYPQQWTGNQYQVDDSSFGVELLIPVDSYQKSMRSVKYAVLFIALTFLVFLFAEILYKIRVHPIHYLLTGLSLTVFYSLLTALSEYMTFNLAYLVGAVVIVAMITLYAKAIYRKRNVTIAVLLSLVILYSFLFVILQLADYALLIGNIGLVIILAIVMIFARKINYSTMEISENSNNDVNKNDK